MSVALRYSPSRDDALETCHDAFVKAFENIDSMDEARPFKPWFRRILVHCAIDRHRSTRRYHATIEPEAEPPEAPVDADALADLQAEEILALFAELSDAQRDVFNLYEIEGYSHEEIADLLGMAVGTSRSHLTRARKRLQTLYLQHASS